MLGRKVKNEYKHKKSKKFVKKTKQQDEDEELDNNQQKNSINENDENQEQIDDDLHKQNTESDNLDEKSEISQKNIDQDDEQLISKNDIQQELEQDKQNQENKNSINHKEQNQQNQNNENMKNNHKIEDNHSIQSKKNEITQEITKNIAKKMSHLKDTEIQQVQKITDDKKKEKQSQKIDKSSKQQKNYLSPKMPDLSGFEAVNVVERLSPYSKSLYEEYKGDLPSQELTSAIAQKSKYDQNPVLITDILSNHITGTITPILPSTTKSGLWTTSSVPIKKMKEVFYETEGMPYERIERGGEPLYVENPIQSARANIILKKHAGGVKMSDFINIQNPVGSSSHEETDKDDRKIFEQMIR